MTYHVLPSTWCLRQYCYTLCGVWILYCIYVKRGIQYEVCVVLPRERIFVTIWHNIINYSSNNSWLHYSNNPLASSLVLLHYYHSRYNELFYLNDFIMLTKWIEKKKEKKSFLKLRMEVDTFFFKLYL